LINSSRHQLLVALGRYTYLSAPELTRLLYGTKILKFVMGHLSWLYNNGYAERVFLPAKGRGRALAIYTLTNKGYSYLKQQGLEPQGRFRASEQAERRPWFLEHTLAANDLLILSELLAQRDTSTTLVRMKTERELKHSPSYVDLPGRRSAVIPDGWVILERSWSQRARPSRHPIAFELDQATIERKAFQRKITALAEWCKGGYQRLDATSLTIAFVTTGSARRLEEILAWTEAELTDSANQAQAAYFLFAAFEPSQADPQEVFLSPIFRQPFSSKAVALLEEPQDS
jgi:hypothetical protein